MPDLESAAVTGKKELEYERSAESFDEMVLADGSLRPHWRGFVDQIETMGLAELRHRWEEAKHLIRENGVTYNVYGDPQGMDRPWELDPLPLVIAPAEAASVEAGLIQRAHLLDLVLADLYGPQKLLLSGALPPQLVFGHPSYLRPCHGVKIPGDRYLHLYAADVGRAPDGSFHVLADRTQAPSGAGYVLENRIVLSRMLPEVFRDCKVQRLALFFRAMRETLRTIAPHDRDNPRVVLLTPGPFNATYFEHAFLASYLGYTLVEGSDLTVRDNRVYLKLLGGLQPVDVILRRLDDTYCDPLELRRDSFLGVPGLVQAIRAGNVALANPLGSGLMESPAMLAYLPALCRSLLGEELKLPSVPTFWCGDPVALEHVLAHLPRMVIKPILDSRRTGPIFGEELGAAERQALGEAIRSRPGDYVGQEQLQLSTAPVLGSNGLAPRHLVIRTFLTASESHYAVMPGGLARIAASADSLVVSMQRGGGSKDTWVLSDGPVSTFSLLPTTVQPVELRRDGGDLPSRAADNLYWLGRYVDRVETVVRLLRGILIRSIDQSGLTEVPEIPSLMRALTNSTRIFPRSLGAGTEEGLSSLEKEVSAIIGDADRAGSLAASIHGLHRIAHKVRDRLSTDMWRILSNLELDEEVARAPDRDAPALNAEAPIPAEADRGSRRRLGELRDLLDRTVISLAAFGGLVADSMTRGQGLRFLEMGRRLERSLQISILLRSTLVSVNGPDGPLLDALLEISDSSMTYRRRYMSQLAAAPVLDLLLADEANPRSLAYQLAALAEGIEHLPRTEFAPGRSEAARIVLVALTRLRVADIGQLARVDQSGYRPELEDLLAKFESDVPALSDALARNYFSHLEPPRQFATSSDPE
jgi:uncharacterized circularly permuted ATP-grasp superfamily protein/uncharacterized alpha-E superfamily protein